MAWQNVYGSWKHDPGVKGDVIMAGGPGWNKFPGRPPGSPAPYGKGVSVVTVKKDTYRFKLSLVAYAISVTTGEYFVSSYQGGPNADYQWIIKAAISYDQTTDPAKAKYQNLFQENFKTMYHGGEPLYGNTNWHTKAYVQTKLKSFKSYFVVFQSSVDLSKEFGTVDAPKMETSQGNQYDNMTSPVNLYAIHYEYFNGLMKILAPYPWIMQNIQLLMMIPDDFINLEDLVTVKAKEFNYENLKTFKKGGKSLNKELDGINYSINELCNIYGIDHNEEKHLLRTGYTTAEIYSWDGQRILLDNAFLDENTGIKFRAKTSIGYENKIALYPINYKTTEKEKAVKNSKGEILIDKGSFLNDAIIYDNFTELPILIDNYRLSKASNAYSRQLAEDRLPSNRINSTVKDITSGNLLGNMQSGNLQGTQGSFYNAVNLLSDLKPQSVLSKFENEYEFYRNQRAEFADMALKAPTITNQSPGTAFQMANEINGLTIKLSAPSEQEFAKVKKYYKMFGYEIEEDGKQISDIESMTICNFLQIRGNYKIHGVDVALMEQLKAQLENGVRFWHNNNTSNPMEQDIQKNKMR